jgi:lipopolysaccharide transport system ATP-binding protein
MFMPIIEVKNLGKKYNISHRQGGYVALRDVLTNVFRNPFRFLKQKAKEATGLAKKEEFWALKDLNFTVEKGEVVGIIGANGAGKSTLLKILSQITTPTTGEVRIHGRVGSLLEVGTGFHPELTGRENIYLNGSILGMKREEIVRKFDEIVAFSGVEKFLDTPVKYYSSGMYVRLAFAVAAHLEPDILIIDEVLAVGDAEFQKKCLGKMDEITKKEGRTILFVSHNMGAISQLCEKTILLKGGQIEKIGRTSEVINEYLKNYYSLNNISLSERNDRQGSGDLKVTSYSLKNAVGEDVLFFTCGQNSQIWLDYEIKNENINEIDISIGVDSVVDQRRVAFLSNQVIGKKINITPDRKIKVEINNLPLNVGRYQFTFYIECRGNLLDWVQAAGVFEVNFGHFYNTGKLPPTEGAGDFLLNYDFKTE